MSHALPNGDVTMDDPWTPAVGGSEPFPERGSGGVDHGWLMNVDARTVAHGSDQVSAAWEWSQNALTFVPVHEARVAAFSNVDGTLRRRLAEQLATAEVVLDEDMYQISATARVGPLAFPRYSDPLVPPRTGDVGASGEVVVEQGTWGVDVGSDSGSIPEPPGPPAPWDDLLPPGRVDVFYFEVEVLDRKTSSVRFLHEAFTLDGARLPSAAVVVPHG